MQRHLTLALALAAAGLLGTRSTVAAQDSATARPPVQADSVRRPVGAADRLLQQRAELKLTDEQVKKLEEIKSKYPDRPADEAAARRMREQRRAAWKESMAVLTPDQRDQLKAKVREHRGEWKGKGDSMHRGRHRRHHEPSDSTQGT